MLHIKNSLYNFFYQIYQSFSSKYPFLSYSKVQKQCKHKNKLLSKLEKWTKESWKKNPLLSLISNQPVQKPIFVHLKRASHKALKWMDYAGVKAKKKRSLTASRSLSLVAAFKAKFPWKILSKRLKV